MPSCKNCGESFPCFVKLDGKRIDCRNRIYCLNCNPFGAKNFWGGRKTNRVLGITRDQRLDYICKTCGKKHSNKSRNLDCYACKCKKIRNKRKADAVRLMGGKCFICGYDKCKDAFAFHHINPSEKSFDLANSWEIALDVLLLELKKCVLLCCRCHCEVHNGMTKLDISLR